MEGNNIIGMIPVFIGVAIFLGIGTLILGQTDNAASLSSQLISSGLSLTSTGELVPVSGHDAQEASTVSFVTETGQSILSFEYDSRIRQAGTVERVWIETGPDATHADITGIYFDVWRQDGATYDRVGQSANVVTDFQAIGDSSSGFIDINIPGVQEGDYMGITSTADSGPHSIFRGHPGDSSVGLYRIIGTPTSTDFDWEAQLSGVTELHFQYYMDAPSVVFIGDSITAGAPLHQAYIKSGGTNDAPTTTVPYKVGQLLGVPIQNMGDGTSGINDSEDIKLRFTEDVVDLSPRAVVLGIGTADVAAGVPLATYSANMQEMITEAKNAGIVPVIQKIYPRDYGTLGVVDAADTNRLLFNDELESLAASNDIPIIENSAALGDGLNPLGINPTYNSGDDIHYNEAGHDVIASLTSAIISTSASSSSWAVLQEDVAQTSQSSFGLLMVVLLVLAAVIILGVIRQLN